MNPTTTTTSSSSTTTSSTSLASAADGSGSTTGNHKNRSSSSSSFTPLSPLVRMFSCTYEALALYRIVFGTLLTIELLNRYRYLHAFYTNDGTYPLPLLYQHIDTLYFYTCILHCTASTLLQQQILLGIHVFCSIIWTLGCLGRRWNNLLCFILWYLYLSLTLRNIWLSYILDRYIHYLLFISAFLPLHECYTMSSVLFTRKNKTTNDDRKTIPTTITPSPKTHNDADDNNLSQRQSTSSYCYLYISPATISIKLLLFWIYLDAGYGKYQNQGWSYHAYPLPALDTYARHTVVAQYITTIIGGTPGWRILTPLVVYIELFSVPITLLGWILSNPTMIYIAVISITALHIGIASTIRNATLLSLIAISPWITFLPIGSKSPSTEKKEVATAATTIGTKTVTSSKWTTIVSLFFLGSMIVGNIWFETIGRTSCYSMTTTISGDNDNDATAATAKTSTTPQQTIWSTLLHNRWNVFVGAEEYVTWEIAPGLLVDGTTVDVWKNSTYIDWNLPTTSSSSSRTGGAPCTATARYGRWRSFPYLSNFTIDSPEYHALWGYLCTEWNTRAVTEQKQLMKYNFFMLQADVLPNMQFTATRKRLIVSYECVLSSLLSTTSPPRMNDDTTLATTVATSTLTKDDGIGLHNEL